MFSITSRYKTWHVSRKGDCGRRGQKEEEEEGESDGGKKDKDCIFLTYIAAYRYKVKMQKGDHLWGEGVQHH